MALIFSLGTEARNWVENAALTPASSIWVVNPRTCSAAVASGVGSGVVAFVAVFADGAAVDWQPSTLMVSAKATSNDVLMLAFS
jgi:hypothetical protein